jgi:hypothetical protein
VLDRLARGTVGGAAGAVVAAIFFCHFKHLSGRKAPL